MYIVIKAFVVWLIFYSINATLNGLEASNLLGGKDCQAIKTGPPEPPINFTGEYIKQNHMQYF